VGFYPIFREDGEQGLGDRTVFLVEEDHSAQGHFHGLSLRTAFS
jgi:hypothetical protein